MTTKTESKLRHSSITKIRHLAVYQPATPLRCVIVFIDDDGSFFTTEEPVLGIQAIVRDVYIGPKVPLGHRGPQPDGSSEKDILRAGYDADHDDQLVDHHIVVLSDEYQQPSVVDDHDMCQGNWRRVIGPKDAPAHWWEWRINEAKKRLKDDHQPKRTITSTQAQPCTS